MGTLFVSGSPGGSPTLSRRKPMLAVRRSFRKQVRKLLHSLTTTLKRDLRELNRAEQEDYDPLLFIVRPGNKVETAVNTLVDRCMLLLKATIS